MDIEPSCLLVELPRDELSVDALDQKILECAHLKQHIHKWARVNPSVTNGCAIATDQRNCRDVS